MGAIQGTTGLCRQAAQGWRSPALVGRVPDLLCQDGPPGWYCTHHAGPDQGCVEGYGGLKLWTPGFKRNLYGRSSSYGRWSVDVFGTLMPRLVQMCLKSVCVREIERAMCMYIRMPQPVKRRRFCNSDAQVCTDMLEHSPDGSAALVQMCRDESHLHTFVC